MTHHICKPARKKWCRVTSMLDVLSEPSDPHLSLIAWPTKNNKANCRLVKAAEEGLRPKFEWDIKCATAAEAGNAKVGIFRQGRVFWLQKILHSMTINCTKG